MTTVAWSPRALGDVKRLHGFLAPKDPAAARQAARTLRGAASMLSRHPEVGRMTDRLPAEFREWIVGFGNAAYVLLYRYDGRQVLILAVRHSREAGHAGY